MKARRSGYTLVELLIVIVITAVVLGSIYRVLMGQQRATRHQRTVIAAHQDLRTGLAVLAAELRPISPTATATQGGSDLILAEEHKVKFRAFRDVAIVCEQIPNGALEPNLDIWVLAGSFAAGDSVLIFEGAVPATVGDDGWIGAKVTAVDAGLEDCATAWGSHDELDLLLTLDMTDVVNKGALVRSFEVLTYGLFEVNGEWMLARIEDAGTADVDTVPLVGPLAPPENDGLRLRYFDVNGNLMASPVAVDDVGRIEITLRAKREGAIDGIYVDTLTTQVYLRNN